MRRRSHPVGLAVAGPTVLLGCVATWAWPAAAGDVAIGRDLAGQCAVCHGLDGVARMPDAPNIGGESTIYLERQLEAFRSGERTHPQMSVIAQGLSDDDIADLAAYYAAIIVEVVSVPE